MRRYICDLCNEIIEDETDMYQMKIKEPEYDTFYTKFHVHGECLRSLCKEIKNTRIKKLEEISEKIKKLNEQIIRFNKIAYNNQEEKDEIG